MIVGEGKYRYEVVEGWEQLPRAGRTATWPAWRPTPRTASTSSTAASTRSSSTTARASSSTPGATTTLPPAARHHHRGRRRLPRRRHRPHRPQVHPRRQGPDDARRRPASRPTPATAPNAPSNLTTIERAGRPVQPPDPPLRGPERRPLRLGRLRQRPRSTASRSDGELLQSWGEPGTEPGQFNLPHSVWVAHRRPRLRLRPRERPHPDLQPDRRAARDLDQRHPPRRPVHRARTAPSTSARWRWEKGTPTWPGKRWPRTDPPRLTHPRPCDGNVLRDLGREGPLRRRRLLLAARPLGRLAAATSTSARSPTPRSAGTTAGTRAVTRSSSTPASNAQPRPVPLSLWERAGVRVFPVRATISFGIHRGRAPDDDRRRGHVPLRSSSGLGAATPGLRPIPDGRWRSASRSVRRRPSPGASTRWAACVA